MGGEMRDMGGEMRGVGGVWDEQGERRGVGRARRNEGCGTSKET